MVDRNQETTDSQDSDWISRTRSGRIFTDWQTVADQLLAQVDANRRTIDQQEEEIRELKDKNTQLKQDRNKENDSATDNDDNDDEDPNDTKDDRIQILEADNLKLNKRASAMQESLEDVKDKLNKTESINRKYLSDIQANQNQIDNLQKENSTITKELQIAHRTIDQLRDELQALKTEKQEKLLSFNPRIDGFKNGHATKQENKLEINESIKNETRFKLEDDTDGFEWYAKYGRAVRNPVRVAPIQYKSNRSISFSPPRNEADTSELTQLMKHMQKHMENVAKPTTSNYKKPPVPIFTGKTQESIENWIFLIETRFDSQRVSIYNICMILID